MGSVGNTLSLVKQAISKIESLLDDNNVAYVTDNDYINIVDSSTATRIHVFEFQNASGSYYAAVVQEFDEFGNQTYSKEFAFIGKAFLNRVMKNIG